MKLFKIIVAAFFPQRCASCGEIIAENELLCDYCYEMLEHCVTDKLCTKCGLDKKNCQCKSRVFHFEGCVAPFYNSGVAKKTMYAFKFRRKEMYARLFYESMALSVKQCFSNINFDCIAYVPLTAMREAKRGYNQCLLLASGLSETLKLPVINVLACKRQNSKQQNLHYAERFDNVKGKYYTKFKVNGKTVLLVDDIKTTGATLNECAHELLLAGAERVYCVTGLMTDYKRGKKNGN